MPSYEQLVRAELEQLVYFSEEATKARADEEEVARQENGGVPKSEYKQTSHALEELA